MKLTLLLFCLEVRDLTTDFLSTCRKWCQQCTYYLYFISGGASALVARQSRGLISYSDLFLEPSSLLKVQLAFMGNSLKERKFVLPYFSGWLFSNGLVKLSMAGGSHLWRHHKQTTFDHRAQSTTLDSILERKSNFRKSPFNSQQR